MNINCVDRVKIKSAVALFLGCCITVILPYYVLTIRWSSSTLKSRVESSTPVHQQQEQRQGHLHRACSASNDSWSAPLNFIVSHELRLVFCNVGKAAGTSWVRVLLQLTGNPAAQQLAATDRSSVHGMFDYYLHVHLASLQNATQLTSSPFKDYYKFMFVREPLERLVSAYRDKMFLDGSYGSVRKYIIKRFRRHPTPRSLKTGDDVKFKEFVHYVLQEARRRPQNLDTHWRPQCNLCEPCHINYDFIGHYQTLHQDAEHVLRQISRLSNNTDVQFPATDLDNRNRNSRELLRKFYGDISSKIMLRLRQLYKKDYEIFGYNVPDTVR